MLELEKKILPFFWVNHDDSYSVCLNAGEYKEELFLSRADEGFEGGGYDWGSLALVFLTEKMPELESIVNFDPEASMFTAYSSDKKALENFILTFKEACEDNDLILDLFSRAELD